MARFKAPSAHPRHPEGERFLACAAKNRGWRRRARDDACLCPRLLSSVFVSWALYDVLRYFRFHKYSKNNTPYPESEKKRYDTSRTAWEHTAHLQDRVDRCIFLERSGQRTFKLDQGPGLSSPPHTQRHSQTCPLTCWSWIKSKKRSSPLGSPVTSAA